MPLRGLDNGKFSNIIPMDVSVDVGCSSVKSKGIGSFVLVSSIASSETALTTVDNTS